MSELHELGVHVPFGVIRRGACVRPIGWLNQSWGLFVPGFFGGFGTDWVGSCWWGERLSIINDIHCSVFWCRNGDTSQGSLDWFTMVGSDSCILKCRNECGQGCYAMIWWYMLICCRAWSMFVILNWNHGLLVWAWCLVRLAYTNICTLDFAWLNLRRLTGSSANWRRLPFAQLQRTFYQFWCSVSILWAVRTYSIFRGNFLHSVKLHPTWRALPAHAR